MSDSLLERVGLNRSEAHSLRVRLGASGHRDDNVEAIENALSGGEAVDAVDTLRVELLDYIDKNKGRLSLSCDGNCAAHDWAKVIQCHQRMKRDSLI